MKKFKKFIDDLFVMVVESDLAFIVYLLFLLFLGFVFLYIKFILTT